MNLRVVAVDGDLDPGHLELRDAIGLSFVDVCTAGEERHREAALARLGHNVEQVAAQEDLATAQREIQNAQRRELIKQVRVLVDGERPVLRGRMALFAFVAMLALQVATVFDVDMGRPRPQARPRVPTCLAGSAFLLASVTRGDLNQHQATSAVSSFSVAVAAR